MQIIKRDGSREKYDQTKIKRVTMAAGLTEAEAGTLINRINDWLSGSKTTEVNSLTLRDRITEELKSINDDAYNLYSWYEKTLN